MNATPQDRLTIADIQRDVAEATTMRAACPMCERDGRKVHAQHLQATRQRPCQFLGFQGFCTDCQMAFSLAEAQMTL